MPKTTMNRQSLGLLYILMHIHKSTDHGKKVEETFKRIFYLDMRAIELKGD